MEYVHGGFTVFDAMIRDVVGNFQLDIGMIITSFPLLCFVGAMTMMN